MLDAQQPELPKPSGAPTAAAPVLVEPIPLASPDLPLMASIDIALRQNPDLVAIRQTEPVNAAALGVAETYPFNPFVQAQVTPYQDAVDSGPGTTYHYVLLIRA